MCTYMSKFTQNTRYLDRVSHYYNVIIFVFILKKGGIWHPHFLFCALSYSLKAKNILEMIVCFSGVVGAKINKKNICTY